MIQVSVYKFRKYDVMTDDRHLSPEPDLLMQKPIITSADTRIIQYTIGMNIKVDHRGLGRPTLLTISR